MSLLMSLYDQAVTNTTPPTRQSTPNPSETQDVVPSPDGTHTPNSTSEVNVTRADLEDITEKQRPGGEQPITTITSVFNRAREDNERFNDHALLVTRKVDKNGDTFDTELAVQSSIIQNALRFILKSYAYLNLAADPIVLKKPYDALFHYRNEIFEYAEAPERTDEEKRWLKVLTEKFFPLYMTKVVKAWEEDIQKGRVPFNLLWTLFRAEDDIIIQSDYYKELHRVVHCEFLTQEGDQKFCIYTWRWGYNAGKFGPCSETIVIPKYSSTRRIEQLPCFPLKRLDSAKQAKIYQELVARGKKWKELIRPSHREYNGPMWAAPNPLRPPKTYGELEVQFVKGRIMLDHVLHVEAACQLADHLVGVHGYTLNNQEGHAALHRSSMPSFRFGSAGDFKPASMTSRAGQGQKMIFNQLNCFTDDEDYTMTDEEASLSPARARGFSLSEKRWGFFMLEKITPIAFKENSFQSLEMDTKLKDVVRALVQNHVSSAKKFDDFMTDKGKGMVILLEGPPGSGKTLTAESIAELTRKPLYSMGTGELGSRADIAETYLRAIFKRAAKWDAVLLLDEADLFLTKRTASHMERNAFVTLFLRLLEYYQGIMFLTTNRVKEIDRAFDSRIHLSLRFQSPDAKTRAAIWRNFLLSQPDCHSWGTETFKRLGQDLEAHGREIKNLIRTALAIADYNNEPLSEDLLRMIYRIKNENKHDDEAKEAKADNGIPGA